MEAIVGARPEHEVEVVALLRACGLPHADVAAHLPHFSLAVDGGRVVGVIGLEVHGQDGLVRSLAVADDRRGEGIARRLYAALLGRSHRLGLLRLFLLTTTAQGFFELLGFRQIARDAVPEAIRATEEFRTLCPANATCMERPMARG
jgi:amino-acid N-acetyltransferase